MIADDSGDQNQQNHDLGGYSCSGCSHHLQPWERSYAKYQKRIKDHVQNQTEKVGFQRCFGIALGCEKSGQHLRKKGK